MITDDHWMKAGREPRLAEVLSDPTTRDLMRADGVEADDVNAIIDRIRPSLRPLEFVRGRRTATPMTLATKFTRSLSTGSADHQANMYAAADVVSRWIGTLGADKHAGPE